MKFSVIVAAFNCESFIGKAIDSCLEQDFSDFEVIVVDDGSVDGTVNAIRPFLRDSRVQLIEHKKNRGILASRLSGLRRAKGEYIFFLDGDDYLLPGAFSRLYEKTKFGPDIILCKMFVERAQAAWPNYESKEKSGSLTNFYFNNIRNFYWTSATKAISRDKARNLLCDLNFVQDRVCLAEDYLIYSSLLRYVDTYAVVDEPVYYYRDSSSAEKNYPGKEAAISERMKAYNYVFNCVDFIKRNIRDKESPISKRNYESRMLLADARIKKITIYDQMRSKGIPEWRIRLRYYNYVIKKCGIYRFILLRMNRFF